MNEVASEEHTKHLLIERFKKLAETSLMLHSIYVLHSNKLYHSNYPIALFVDSLYLVGGRFFAGQFSFGIANSYHLS